MSGQTTAGRGPKYRTSCDSCQAMKVKCGHEKPSCRRCSSHKLRCVYSLSRRMGRPRAKGSVQDESARQQLNDAPDKTTPTPSTPAVTSADSETAIIPTTSAPSLPESGQTPDPWSLGSIDGDFEVSNPTENTQDPTIQSMTNSLDPLQTFTPMELDFSSGFPALPSFLDDSTTSSDSQAAPSTYLFDPQELPSARLPDSIHKGSFHSIDMQPSPPQQPLSTGDSDHGSRQHSERSSRTDSTSGPSSAISLSNLFDLSSEFLSGMGNTPSLGRGAASTLRHPPVYITPKEDSWPVSGGFSISDRKCVAHCTCTSAILQRIGSLKESQQKASPTLIDSALAMESEVKDCLSRLRHCQNCCHDTSAHLLGLVCIRMVLDILRGAVREEFVSRSSSQVTNSSSRGSCVNRPRPSVNCASPEFRQSSSGSGVGIEGCSLYIGNFKVTPRVRSRFLHKVLRARFHKLSVLVSDWEKFVSDASGSNTVSHDSFGRAASLLLRDAERSLRTVVGWVELGNAKDF